ARLPLLRHRPEQGRLQRVHERPHGDLHGELHPDQSGWVRLQLVQRQLRRDRQVRSDGDGQSEIIGWDNICERGRRSSPRSSGPAYFAALLCRRRERGLSQAANLAITLQHETATVKGGERRAMADRYDRGALEPRVEETVERGFRCFVE